MGVEQNLPGDLTEKPGLEEHSVSGRNVNVRGCNPGCKLVSSPVTFPVMGTSQATCSATSHPVCLFLGRSPPQDPAGSSIKFPHSPLLFSPSGPYTTVFDIFTLP